MVAVTIGSLYGAFLAFHAPITATSRLFFELMHKAAPNTHLFNWIINWKNLWMAPVQWFTIFASIASTVFVAFSWESISLLGLVLVFSSNSLGMLFGGYEFIADIKRAKAVADAFTQSIAPTAAPVASCDPTL